MEKKGIKIAAQNRKAFHDYFVEDRYEAGVELFGTEVKSIRAGTLNLKDSSTRIRTGPSGCCCTSGRSASCTTCKSSRATR